MLNRRTGRIHDFSKKGGLLGLGMAIPLTGIGRGVLS
jgi:hypothetical protein